MWRRPFHDGRELFNALAEVFEAGAKESRSTPFNGQRVLDAATYDAMAKKAREIAEEWA